MARVYLDTTKQNTPKKRVYLNEQPKAKKRVYIDQPKVQQKTTAFNRVMNNLVKPVASASNLLEDTGKTIGYKIAKGLGAKGDASKLGIDFVGHQKDVWSGKNKRTYSNITNEVAKGQDNKILAGLLKTTGYGGDFLLDPLNKVKILSKTKTGIDLAKKGKGALSVAKQAEKGERAVLQIGNTNVLPKFIDKAILGGSTKLNNAIRGTEVGKKVFNVGSKISGKIRPSGVTRKEFKILTDAKTSARNTTGYTADKAVEFAKGLAKTLDEKKATQLERASLLHAIEKGDEALAPEKFKDLWKAGTDFKVANDAKWKELGGATLEGHGLSHVATKEVAEQARKDSFKGAGFKLTSTQTPQDIHRQYVKVNGNIVNLEQEGIKFKDGQYLKGKKPVNVEQASAMEINNALVGQGKKAIFQEDLPIVAAKMGVSTGRKQAGVEFLEATKGLKSEEAKSLANEVHEKMTNPESVRLAIKGFDAIQNIWKAQALMAPSYHIRNIAGNLWNNYLADVKTGAYAIAGNLQTKAKLGKLAPAEKKLIDEMAQHGVIGTGQFTGDIAQAIDSQIGKKTVNPLSQNFVGYRANRAVGSVLEDNAKMAHFISKRAEGYGAKEAAESVKKFLFDYGDLTGVEQGLLKRVMPFYTWTSKNIPLQVQQFIENPGKFSKIATAKKDIEQDVPQPDETYMSDYMKGNAPIRTKVDENGNTMYFLMGSWLPAASALKFLSDPMSETLGMVTPMAKLPYENLTNQGTFFKNTLGEYEDIQKYPGQKTSYLGMDLSPQTVNNLRSIRGLNELDKLNPGGIFGGKNEPSIFQGVLDNASNQRGGKYTPDTSQADRITNAFVGKLNPYDVEDSKKYYDRDTENRVTDYKAELNRALGNNQTELAQEIIQEMSQFIQERSGEPNKDMQMYDLMGDRYFEDMARNKQAEKQRDSIREDMRKQIRQGIASNDYSVVTEALKLDPTYAKQAVSDALKEKTQEGYSSKQKQMMYEIEQLKNQKRLNSFYK